MIKLVIIVKVEINTFFFKLSTFANDMKNQFQVYHIEVEGFGQYK